MNKPFRCSCGIETTEPFLIGGVKMCAVCADEMAPEIVSARARRTWREFENEKRRRRMFPDERFTRKG